MNKQILCAKALFMVLLIITLPVYISKAYAADELNVVKYSGKDDVNGYFGQYDNWNLEVDAKAEGDAEITSSQVKINNFPFNSCAPAAPGYYKCIYTGESYSIPPGSYPATFTLESDAGETLVTTTKTMTVDNLEPVIEFTKNPVQNMQNVSVGFTIKDRAFEQNKFDLCSGIKRVEFWDGATELDSTFPNDTSACIFSKEVNLPLPASNRITIKAYDNMGNLAVKVSPSFMLDNNAPDFIEETFAIYKGKMLIGDYISGQPFSATIYLRIRDDGLINPAKTKADFSGLGAGSAVKVDNCVKAGREYQCQWNNVPVAITSAQTVNIVFTTEDAFGNTAEKIITRTFSVDSSAPVITFIGTDSPFEGKGFIGSIPIDVVVKLSESGSGMSDRNIYLDLSDLGAYGANKQADECNQTGGEWACRWKGLTTAKPHGSSVAVYVVTARDNSGNDAAGINAGVLGVDRQPPVNTAPQARAIAEIARALGIIASNDEVIAYLNGTDDSGVKAYGDFSRVYNVPGSDKLEAECIKEGLDYECAWDLSSVMSGYIKANVPITLIDSAGNSKVVQLPFEIFVKDFEDTPDYWNVASVEMMPFKIERKITALIRQRVYAKVNLVSGAGATTVETKLGQCTGDTGYMNSISIFNNQRGSSTPYILYELKTSDVSGIEKLTVNCTLNIVSLYGKKLTNIEAENVSVKILFYNSSLGEASEEDQDKIDDLKEKYIEGWWQWIGTIDKILYYAKMICSIYGMFRSIVAIFQAVTVLVGVAEQSTQNTYGYAITHPTRVGLCKAKGIVRLAVNRPDKPQEGLTGFADKFCGFVNCKYDAKTAAKEGLSTWSSFLSFMGNGGICGYIDFQKYSLAGLITGGRMGSQPQVQDSLILSVCYLCVPGIIYNLNKYRQIQCMYISCMQTGVEQGIPLQVCDEAKEEATCKYVYGEIFQLVSWFLSIQPYINTLKEIITNPYKVLDIAIAYSCLPLCSAPNEWPHKGCAWFKVITELADVVTQIQAWQETWGIRYDYCEDVEEAED